MSKYFFLEFSFTDDNFLADDFLVQIRQHQQTNLHREAAAVPPQSKEFLIGQSN